MARTRHVYSETPISQVSQGGCLFNVGRFILLAGLRMAFSSAARGGGGWAGHNPDTQEFKKHLEP